LVSTRKPPLDDDIPSLHVTQLPQPRVCESRPYRHHENLELAAGLASGRSPYDVPLQIEVQQANGWDKDSLKMGDVITGTGYRFADGQNDLRLHFGLGTSDHAGTVEIRWPLGLREVYRNVKGNQILVLKEGSQQ